MITLPICFRCWDTKAKRFIDEVPPREYMLDCEDWHHVEDDSLMQYPANPLRTFGNRLVYDQFTGLKDKTGREIYAGDILVTENDHANGGLYSYDDWKAEDNPPAVVSLDLRWGVRMESKDGDVWSWDQEDSIYHVGFLRVVGNVRENLEMFTR